MLFRFTVEQEDFPYGICMWLLFCWLMCMFFLKPTKKTTENANIVYPHSIVMLPNLCVMFVWLLLCARMLLLISSCVCIYGCFIHIIALCISVNVVDI